MRQFLRSYSSPKSSATKKGRYTLAVVPNYSTATGMTEDRVGVFLWNASIAQAVGHEVARGRSAA